MNRKVLSHEFPSFLAFHPVTTVNAQLRVYNSLLNKIPLYPRVYSINIIIIKTDNRFTQTLSEID